MKQTKQEIESSSSAKMMKQSIPTPPPPPPLPRFLVQKTVAESVTNQEIAKFWKRKQIAEEDHFLAALKAAARIRARNFSKEEYEKFEESLKDDNDMKETKAIAAAAATNSTKHEKNNEVRVGIKDWWTKSNYAYLNQPAIESTDPSKRRTSTYIPNCFSFKPTPPLYPTSLGVF